MERKKALWLLLGLVFLVVFNVVFFVAGGTNHPLSVWISYAFIHLAYFMLVATPFLTRKTTNTAVLGMPLFAISTGYFFVALIVGVVFIILRPESIKICIIVQVIIAAIYAIMLISHMIANEKTADSVERHEKELRYIKDASSKLKGIMDSTSDKNLRKKVESLYDLLHSSPAKSNDTVRSYELTVLNLIEELQNSIINNDIPGSEAIISKIEITANERNRALKSGN